MKYKKKFHKKRKPRERQMDGLKVEVYNNNIDMALRKLKRKIKDSNLFLELRNKTYYVKKSERLREKRNLAKLRYKYSEEKK